MKDFFIYIFFCLLIFVAMKEKTFPRKDNFLFSPTSYNYDLFRFIFLTSCYHCLDLFIKSCYYWLCEGYSSHPVIIVRAILSLTSCYYHLCDTISDILLLSFVRYYLWHPVIIVRAILSLTSCYYCLHGCYSRHHVVISCMDPISNILLLLFVWILFHTSCFCLCRCYSSHPVISIINWSTQ